MADRASERLDGELRRRFDQAKLDFERATARAERERRLREMRGALSGLSTFGGQGLESLRRQLEACERDDAEAFRELRLEQSSVRALKSAVTGFERACADFERAPSRRLLARAERRLAAIRHHAPDDLTRHDFERRFSELSESLRVE